MTSFYRVSNEEQKPELGGTSDPPLDKFLVNAREKMRIDILKEDEEQIVFDIKGIDASLANALRRILLAEVPTVAIETVYIEVNTSIIQDEVLSHRLGLIPIKVDPSMFADFEVDDIDGPTDLNTTVFKLDVSCTEDSCDEEDGTM
jgi:DNA-directed RNA polymerase I and III subunit RPAC1